MSKDAETTGTGRLWSSGAAREKPARPEPPQRQASNVMPLHPDRTYKAFDLRDHPVRLHLCCATQPSHYPAYSSLLNIIHDHNFDRAFTLVYSFMLVEVTGNHLGAIVHAIGYGNCERISEFHAKLHDRPAVTDPIVESVRITAAVGGTDRR